MKNLIIVATLALGFSGTNALAQRALNVNEVLPQASEKLDLVQVHSRHSKFKKYSAKHFRKYHNKSLSKSESQFKNTTRKRHTGRSEQFNNPTELFRSGSLIDRAIYLNN